MVKYFTAYIIWNKAQTTLFHEQQHKGIVQDVSETCIYMHAVIYRLCD